MDAITTQPISTLIGRLEADFPAIRFAAGNNFKWSAKARTITYKSDGAHVLFLLHELAHAQLGHADFALDVELLAQERDAWQLVRSKLSPAYNVPFSEGAAEQALDTYRDWLDARSRCPACGLSSLQTKTSTYTCVNCRCSWRPNDARQCALRRYVWDQTA